MAETIKAGLELDELVGREIMGWRIEAGRYCNFLLDEQNNCRYPSQNYADAFAVVERMRELKWRCNIETFMDCEPLVTFNHDDGAQSRQAVNESGETIPECICLAALAAIKQGEGN
jgi:hypothetical protein